MQSVLATVAPVFGLIALGFAIARVGFVSESTGRGVAEFVFSVAMPALLFRLMLDVQGADVGTLGLLASYYGATALVWGLAAVSTHYLLKRPGTDGASISMATGFGNIVMLGIPLALERFGTEAGAPTAWIVSVSSPLLWFAGTLHIELAAQRGAANWLVLLRDLLLNLVRNPIIFGMLAGMAWSLTGLGLTPILDKTVALLGQAAVPCALVALGTGLATFEVRGQAPSVMLICVLSLLLMPAVAWLLAFHVFSMPPLWAAVAVLLAACPPGANAFLFASHYDAATHSVSASVAVGTALSAITIAVLMVLLDMKIAAG